MSRQFTSILTLPVLSAGVVAAERFVTFAGALAGAGANTLGVSRVAATAAGQMLTIDAEGTAAVEAGAAIAAGAALETDATGRAITKSAGPTVARAMQAATAAGEFIEVRLIAN